VTNDLPDQGRGDDDQEHAGDILAVLESTGVRERLVRRTCGWCGNPVEYSGVGRPPQYCRDSHRKRASEMRRVAERAARPVAEGGQTREPVREVIERTETLTRTVVRRGRARLTLPEDAHQWAAALDHLRHEAESGRIPDYFREQLAASCEATARTLRGSDTAVLAAPPAPPAPSAVPLPRAERRRQQRAQRKKR
jgi:hypothetical protein